MLPASRARNLKSRPIPPYASRPQRRKAYTRSAAERPAADRFPHGAGAVLSLPPFPNLNSSFPLTSQKPLNVCLDSLELLICQKEQPSTGARFPLPLALRRLTLCRACHQPFGSQTVAPVAGSRNSRPLGLR